MFVVGVFFKSTGFYCEEGTTSPSPCEPGFYNRYENGPNVSACVACSMGRYCPFYNMTEDGLPCPEGAFLTLHFLTARDLYRAYGTFSGFFCPSGSSNQTEQCPRGFYCPEGIDAPQECPPGTWSDQLGLNDSSFCYPCTGLKRCFPILIFKTFFKFT